MSSSLITTIGIILCSFFFLKPALALTQSVVSFVGFRALFGFSSILFGSTMLLKGFLFPVAVWVLTSPEAVKSTFGPYATALSLVVIVLTCLALLQALFSGFPSFLGVVFWLGLSLVGMESWKFNFSPTTLIPTSSSSGQSVQGARNAASTSVIRMPDILVREAPRQSSLKEDGMDKNKSNPHALEYSSFQNPAMHPTIASRENPDTAKSGENWLTSVSKKIDDFIASFSSNSPQSLPQEAYFPGKPKKQYYGFANGDDSDAGSSEGFLDSILRYFSP